MTPRKLPSHHHLILFSLHLFLSPSLCPYTQLPLTYIPTHHLHVISLSPLVTNLLISLFFAVFPSAAWPIPCPASLLFPRRVIPAFPFSPQTLPDQTSKTGTLHIPPCRSNTISLAILHVTPQLPFRCFMPFCDRPKFIVARD